MPNSHWLNEVRAVFRKEAQCEFRGRNGLATGAVFCALVSVTMAFIFFNRNVNNPENDLRTVAGGTLWVAILFGMVLTLPRTFLSEAEAGTDDLLRLMAHPHSVWWGKFAFNALQALALTAITAGLFHLMVSPVVAHPAMLLLALLGGSLAIAGTVTVCGALASGASGRAALSATLAVPLLLGLLQQAVAAMRAAYGAGLEGAGWAASWGLLLYAMASAVIGPYIYSATWKN